MSAATNQVKKIIEAQPEGSSYEEILRELLFARIVERGLDDSDNGCTISNQAMPKRIRSRRT